jgi:hypothetical protein
VPQAARVRDGLAGVVLLALVPGAAEFQLPAFQRENALRQRRDQIGEHFVHRQLRMESQAAKIAALLDGLR